MNTRIMIEIKSFFYETIIGSLTEELAPMALKSLEKK